MNKHVYPTPMLSAAGTYEPATSYGDFGGITLRQHYAGIVMGSMVNSLVGRDDVHRDHFTKGSMDGVFSTLAKMSWRAADALLKSESENDTHEPLLEGLTGKSNVSP